jgi:DNA-binding transcriptional ArsR family regulator
MRTSVFDAIASPTRRQIIASLAAGERNASQLVKRARLSQPAISQQLTILRDAGLVTERKDGRFRWYSLRAEPLRELAEWVDAYRTFWNARLDALGAVLDETAKPRANRGRR